MCPDQIHFQSSKKIFENVVFLAKMPLIGVFMNRQKVYKRYPQTFKEEAVALGACPRID